MVRFKKVIIKSSKIISIVAQIDHDTFQLVDEHGNFNGELHGSDFDTIQNIDDDIAQAIRAYSWNIIYHYFKSIGMLDDDDDVDSICEIPIELLYLKDEKTDKFIPLNEYISENTLEDDDYIFNIGLN